MPEGPLCVMFSCVFVTFPYGVHGQVWCLIVSITDLCLVLYFSKLCWCVDSLHTGKY